MKYITLILILALFASAVCADCIPGDPYDGESCPDGSSDGSTATGGYIEITSVKVSPSKPAPGEVVKVTIKLESKATEEIKDIEVTIDFDGLEDDEGDDIEDDDTLDMSEDDEEKLEFSFTMPYDVEDGDTYKINVNVQGEGEDSKDIYSASNSDETITVNKDSHALSMSDVSISPTYLKCDDSVIIGYNLWNIGSNDEYVYISITNEQLGINYKKDFELEEDEETRESITLKPKLTEGTHTITLKAKYGSRTVTDTVELNIQECERPKTKAQEPQVLTKTPVKTETNQVIQATPVQKKQSTVKFTDTDEYLFLLTILFIFIAGLVVFAIGAVIILLRR